MIVYAVIDDSLSLTSPLGDAIETFILREDAERFVEKVRGDDPDLASYLRIEERELEAGGPTFGRSSKLSEDVVAGHTNRGKTAACRLAPDNAQVLDAVGIYVS